MQRREFCRNMSLLGLTGAAVAGTSKATAQQSNATARAYAPPMPEGVGGDLKFSAAEYERRYQGVREAMAQDSIDALVIIGTSEWSNGDMGNIRYLGAPEHLAELSLMILPLDGNPVAPYADFGFPSLPPFPPGVEPFKPKVPSPVTFDLEKIPVRDVSLNSPDYAAGVVQMLKGIGFQRGRLGFASMKNMPADIYAAVTETFSDAEIVDAQDILLNMRLYKSDEEVKFMQRSGYIADKGLEAMINTAGVGVSDYEVYFAIDRACAEAGAPVGGFQLYGSGPWGGPPGSTSNLLLYPGSARTIQQGDMLIPEVASNYKGYFTQLTVPVSVGQPTDDFLKAYELCTKVHSAIRSEFRVGKTVREMDAFTAAFTKDATDGEFTTLFGVQAGEHEYSFWHVDYELRPGAMAYNQPFFMPLTKMGAPFHVFGDAMVMTDDEPLILHQSSMDLVII